MYRRTAGVLGPTPYPSVGDVAWKEVWDSPVYTDHGQEVDGHNQVRCR